MHPVPNNGLFRAQLLRDDRDAAKFGDDRFD